MRKNYQRTKCHIEIQLELRRYPSNRQIDREIHRQMDREVNKQTKTTSSIDLSDISL